jgi:HSP20 family protein
MRLTMDRLFDDALIRPRRRFMPARDFAAMVPVEVSETEDAVEVKASLPGVKPEEVDVSIHNDVLTIKAEHKEERTEGEEKPEEGKRTFYRRELRYGAFHRQLALPASVDADKAEATFKDGLLTLRLPKAEADRPKQIKVGGTATS